MSNVEIQEFFIEGSQGKDGHVLLHIAEPDSAYEKKQGYFFALAQLKNLNSKSILALQGIIDTIETELYSPDSEATLEQILEEINKENRNLANKGKQELHCVLGTLTDETVSFAYHGAPEVSVFYKKGESLRSVEVLDSDAKKDTQDDHLFSAIVEGPLHKGDYLYMCTPSVTEYFSTDRVKKIITSRSAHQAAKHIEKVLTDLRDEQSFGGIFVHVPKTVRGKSSSAESKGSQQSLDDLIESTQKTAETLSPPLFGGLSKKIKSQLNADTKSKKPSRSAKKDGNPRLKRQEKRTQSTSDRFLIGLGKVIVHGVNVGVLIFKKIFSIIGTTATTLFYLTTNKGGRREVIIRRYKDRMHEITTYVSSLPTTSKVLFVATAILGIGFISTISYLKVKENKEAANAHFTSTLQAIIDKRDAAEARMIYGEDAQASDFLLEAQTYIDEIIALGKEENADFQHAKNSIEKLQLKLRNIVKVEPRLITDISSADVNSSDITSIVRLEDMIYAYGEETPYLLAINRQTGKIDSKPHETIPHLKLASVPKEHDKIVFITRGNNLAEFDSESNAVSPRVIGYANDDAQIAAAVVYSRRLYAIDVTNNQIYRHSPTQTGYDRGTEWIKSDSADIRNAQAMTIDGDIFILNKDATVTKLAGGIPSPFDISGVKPELENPTDITTYNDMRYLYILEPEHDRIVVLEKDGRFVKQYTADAWTDLKSMIIEEDQSVGYILSGSQVYSFEL